MQMYQAVNNFCSKHSLARALARLLSVRFTRLRLHLVAYETRTQALTSTVSQFRLFGTRARSLDPIHGKIQKQCKVFEN